MGEKKFLDNSGLSYLWGKIQTLMEEKAGKGTVKFVVGTSAAGWTAAACDYLCTGSRDDTVINQAIGALPAAGGEIVLLDGTYNIYSGILLNKPGVTLRGRGTATKLVRTGDGDSTYDALVKITGDGCTVSDMSIDGVKDSFSGVYACNFRIDGNNNKARNIESQNGAQANFRLSGTNNILEGCISIGAKPNGITMPDATHCVITGNICTGSGYSGINVVGTDNVITGNSCSGNSDCGIYVNGSGDRNTITGNTCNNNGEYGIQLYSGSANNTCIGNTCIGNALGDIRNGGTDNLLAPPHTHTAADVGAAEADLSNVENATFASKATSAGVGGKIYEATIGTSWTEDTSTGVKSQTVSIPGITAENTVLNMDVDYTGDGTSAGYETFVNQQNQFLEFITNGYAETVEGGIKFYIFGDANTISIPIIVEVI